MDERERRRRQAAKARRLLAKVQRARLGTAGDRPDPKTAALLRILETGKAAGGRKLGSRRLSKEIEDLSRRIRRNEPAWSLDSATMRISRHLRRGSYGRRFDRIILLGDPTTDYGDSTTDYEADDPSGDEPGRGKSDYGGRKRSALRTIRRARSRSL